MANEEVKSKKRNASSHVEINGFRWSVFTLSVLLVTVSFFLACVVMSKWGPIYAQPGSTVAWMDSDQTAGFAFGIMWILMLIPVVLYLCYLVYGKSKNNRVATLKEFRILSILNAICAFFLLVSFSCYVAAVTNSICDAYIGIGIFGLFGIFGMTHSMVQLDKKGELTIEDELIEI